MFIHRNSSHYNSSLFCHKSLAPKKKTSIESRPLIRSYIFLAGVLLPESPLRVLRDPPCIQCLAVTLLTASHGGGSGEGEDCDGVDRGVNHAHLHDDAKNDDYEDGPVDILEEILCRLSQREDMGYDDDGGSQCRCQC